MTRSGGREMVCQLGVSFGVLVLILQFQLQTCSAGSSPATKLISGIWTEEGCIVPHEDKSRKIWAVAKLWLLDDPVEPCNSPCGCPPEGLNPPFVVKPSSDVSVSVASVPLVVQISQLATSKVPEPPLPPRFPPKVSPFPPGTDCFVPGLGFFNRTQLPPFVPPPFVGPLPPYRQPLPLPIAPPYFGPPLTFPQPPYFIGPLPPQPVLPPPRIPPYPNPILRPAFEKVPIDLGFSRVPPSVPVYGGISSGTSTTTSEDYDKTHLNVNYDSDRGSKNTTTSITGSVATGVPLVVSPPQVGISTGSTTVTQEDWDKEKFNANYDKDKGSKQTVTTTGGTASLVAAPEPCLCGPGRHPAFGGIIGGGATTVTQQDWDKEKFNANYDKDKGTKHTVTTTGGNVGVIAAPQPCQLHAAVSPKVVATGGTTSVTQEDWNKEKFNANYDKDKGIKQTVTTTGGTTSLVAAPEPCLCGPGRHPAFGGVVGGGATTSVTQEDWDKQNMHLNYDKDHGSRTNFTTTGAGIGFPGGMYPNVYGPLYGPLYPPGVSHVDVGILLPPVPSPQGPFAAIVPPLHHPPLAGPPAPFVPPPVDFGNTPVEFFPPPYPVPAHHGFPSLTHFLKPILEHVIVDLGDNPSSVPLDDLSAPTSLDPGTLPPSPPPCNLTQPAVPGRFPSLISKIPIVGPLLKPYLEPVAVNVGDTPLPSDMRPSIGKPIGPLFHTVPIQLGTASLHQQPLYPDYPPFPVGPLVPPTQFPPVTLPTNVLPSLAGNRPVYFPPPPPSLLPAGIPQYASPFSPPGSLSVGTLPASVSPHTSGGDFLVHKVPIDYGFAPPFQNLQPPPTFSPGSLPPPSHFTPQLPDGILQHPPPISGNFQVPVDFGIALPIHNMRPSGPPIITDLGPPPPLGVLPNRPPPSLNPLPLGPPGITELRPPPSLGPFPQGPPPDLDFLPKDPSYTRPPTLPAPYPSLTVSGRNPNVLVNQYGGGVVKPGSVQVLKCPFGNGRCGRDVKDFDSTATTAENHLRSEERVEVDKAPLKQEIVPEKVAPSEAPLPLASNVLTILQTNN